MRSSRPIHRHPNRFYHTHTPSPFLSQTITHDQMAAGFTRVLASADDLLLDIPDAAHLLALFLGRAIVDELLPPAFLAAALPSLRADGLGVAVIRTTGEFGDAEVEHPWCP